MDFFRKKQTLQKGIELLNNEESNDSRFELLKQVIPVLNSESLKHVTDVLGKIELDAYQKPHLLLLVYLRDKTKTSEAATLLNKQADNGSRLKLLQAVLRGVLDVASLGHLKNMLENNAYKIQIGATDKNNLIMQIQLNALLSKMKIQKWRQLKALLPKPLLEELLPSMLKSESMITSFDHLDVDVAMVVNRLSPEQFDRLMKPLQVILLAQVVS